MLKSAKSLIGAILLAVIAAELENDKPGSGDEKKKAAKEKLFTAIDGWLPDWVNPVLAPCAGFLIDALVTLCNRTGFFAQFSST